MVCPEGCGLFNQAVLDIIPKHADYPLYMPIGFAVANGDVLVGDA